MVKIWDPWHPLPLLYYNINIYSLQKKASVESIAELEWCEYFVTFPQGNIQQWICHDHNLLVLQQLHCESLYLHILFSTFRSCTHDCLCLFVFYFLVSWMYAVACGSITNVHIKADVFIHTEEVVVQSIYKGGHHLLYSLYTREVTTYVPR